MSDRRGSSSRNGRDEGNEPGGAGVGLPPGLALRDAHPFVGRDRELAQLRQRLRAGPAARPQLVVLAGEPGVGKTRLARRFAREVHAEGVTVLFGRCDEEPLERYQPFVEAIRTVLADVPVLPAPLPRDVGPLVRLVPELEGRVPPAPGLLAGDAETERYRLFEAVAAFVRLLAGAGPVLLVLDDLQWADRPTLLLLRHLLRQPSLHRLLVVATYRDTDVGRDHPLGELLADLRRDDAVLHRLEVRGLDDTAVMALLERMAGRALEPGELVVAQHLVRVTGGNSFFIRETMRHLVETGGVSQRDGRWELDGRRLQGFDIPDGVREVVLRRVGRLSSEAQRALVHAAVIGREFDVRLLAAITGLDEAAVVDVLDEALASGLVLELDGSVDGFTFPHALVRETLYETVSVSRRVRLHRAVGEAMEAREGDVRLLELARHFAEAPDREGRAKALDYARRAGDQAMELLAFEEAARAYRRALQVLERGSEREPQAEADVLLALGAAQSMAQDRSAAKATFRRAAELASAAELAPPVLIEAALGFAGMFGDPGAPDAETVRLLEQALATAVPDASSRARLELRLAIELIHSPDRHREGMRLADDAVRSAEQGDDPDALAVARWYRRLLVNRPAELPARLALGEETLAFSLRHGSATGILSARGWLVVDHLEAGNVAEAKAQISAYGALVQEMRMPYRRGFPLVWRATLAMLEGRADDAEALSQEALAAAGPDVDGFFFTNWSGQLWALRTLQGRLEELAEAIQAVSDAKPGLLGWRVALAHLYVGIGQDGTARRLYDELTGPPLETLPDDQLRLFTLCLLAELAVRFGDEARAATLERMLRPYADACIVVAYAAFHFGPVALRLGMLNTMLGHHDQAEVDLRHALDVCRALGAWPWVASCELAQATLCDQRGDVGDRERASALRAAVLDTAQANGWLGIVRQAASAGAAPVGASAAKPTPVSPW